MRTAWIFHSPGGEGPSPDRRSLESQAERDWACYCSSHYTDLKETPQSVHSKIASTLLITLTLSFTLHLSIFLTLTYWPRTLGPRLLLDMSHRIRGRPHVDLMSKEDEADQWAAVIWRKIFWIFLGAWICLETDFQLFFFQTQATLKSGFQPCPWCLVLNWRLRSPNFRHQLLRFL